MGIWTAMGTGRPTRRGSGALRARPSAAASPEALREWTKTRRRSRRGGGRSGHWGRLAVLAPPAQRAGATRGCATVARHHPAAVRVRGKPAGGCVGDEIHLDHSICGSERDWAVAPPRGASGE
jgi:hypothetical protein